MNIIKSKIVRTQVTYRIEVDRQTFLQLLNSRVDGGVPDNAAVLVHVPAGGDWSNIGLDVEEGHPIIVTWTEMTNDQE